MAAQGNRTTRRTARAGTDATPDEGTAPEGTAPEETAATTGGPEDTSTDTSTDGPEESAGASEGTDADADTETDTVPDSVEEGPAPSWEEVVPMIALMVGGAPSAEETQAARLLWAMLADTPDGVTAGGFVRRAEEEDWPEIETTTIKSVMTRYERVGIVRCEQTDKGRQRWTLGSPSDVVTAVTTVGSRPRSARTSALAVPATRTASTREGQAGHWAPGELKATVAAYLHDHPDAAFKAQAVCEAIGTHQSGSVRAALDSLTRTGEIVQVTDSPRSWRAAHA